METHYASPQRSAKDVLEKEIQATNHHPLITELMKSLNGLMAVLNKQRQIVAINEAYLKAIGIDDLENVLGLRPGESVRCIHIDEMPGGCGTTAYCSSCGAAIAIVSALEENISTNKKCIISVRKDGEVKEICFQVTCTPFVIEECTYLLLFLRDITSDEMRHCLERAFFHDLNNMIFSLMGNTYLLKQDCENKDELIDNINDIANRLASEISIQRAIIYDQLEHYPTAPTAIFIDKLFDDIDKLFANHPSAKKKSIEFTFNPPVHDLYSDYSLLYRILHNLVLNALEASNSDDIIKVWNESDNETVSFHVWNNQSIPDTVARRIFQCHFSTKEQSGRGIGTYSAKLFTEKILRGEIGFTSSEEKGTTFSVTLPWRMG